MIEQKLPEQPVIRGNRNKLLQVIVNLLQNSLDAMKEQDLCQRGAADDPD